MMYWGFVIVGGAAPASVPAIARLGSRRIAAGTPDTRDLRPTRPAPKSILSTRSRRFIMCDSSFSDRRDPGRQAGRGERGLERNRLRTAAGQRGSVVAR